MPDLLQSSDGITQTIHEVNGVTYSSLEEMPPEVRALFRGLAAPDSPAPSRAPTRTTPHVDQSAATTGCGTTLVAVLLTIGTGAVLALFAG